MTFDSKNELKINVYAFFALFSIVVSKMTMMKT
jgi:hypothetical protein